MRRGVSYGVRAHAALSRSLVDLPTSPTTPDRHVWCSDDVGGGGAGAGAGATVVGPRSHR